MFFNETGHGIVVEFRFFYPYIIKGKHRPLCWFPQVEIGIENAMGQNMLHVPS